MYTTAAGRDSAALEPVSPTRVEDSTDAVRLRRVDRLEVLEVVDGVPTRVAWRVDQTAVCDASGPNIEVAALSYQASYELRIREGEPEAVQVDREPSDTGSDNLEAVVYQSPGTDLFGARILAEEDVHLVVGGEYRLDSRSLRDSISIEALPLTCRFVGIGKHHGYGVANFEFEWDHAEHEVGREVSLRGTLAVDLGTAWLRHSEVRGWMRDAHKSADGSVSTTEHRVHFEFEVDYD